MFFCYLLSNDLNAFFRVSENMGIGDGGFALNFIIFCCIFKILIELRFKRYVLFSVMFHLPFGMSRLLCLYGLCLYPACHKKFKEIASAARGPAID